MPFQSLQKQITKQSFSISALLSCDGWIGVSTPPPLTSRPDTNARSWCQFQRTVELVDSLRFVYFVNNLPAAHGDFLESSRKIKKRLIRAETWNIIKTGLTFSPLLLSRMNLPSGSTSTISTSPTADVVVRKSESEYEDDSSNMVRLRFRARVGVRRDGVPLRVPEDGPAAPSIVGVKFNLKEKKQSLINYEAKDKIFMILTWFLHLQVVYDKLQFPYRGQCECPLSPGTLVAECPSVHANVQSLVEKRPWQKRENYAHDQDSFQAR